LELVDGGFGNGELFLQSYETSKVTWKRAYSRLLLIICRSHAVRTITGWRPPGWNHICNWWGKVKYPSDKLS
jgi:hypothetical protein